MREALITENAHPQTLQLSSLAQHNLREAYQCLASLDQAVLRQVAQQHEVILRLHQACLQAIAQGGRVILVGCGASGRIAAQIEHDWRLTQAHPDQLISVLAGGEVTLIESLEAGEDHPEQAVLQLEALSLSAKDLVIALSAGGESPFILGALAYAKTITTAAPWFLYCNPDAVLLQRNPQHPVGQAGFECFCLAVGPMALTGSTRMQATTAMTFALLCALFPADFRGLHWCDFYQQLDWTQLLPLTEWEESCCRRQEAVIYTVPVACALPVLADTTERSPTFNVPGFVNQLDQVPVLDHYLVLKDVQSGADAAWKALLLRAPRAASPRLLGFDLSQDVMLYLRQLKSPLQMLDLALSAQPQRLSFRFGQQQIDLSLGDLSMIEMQFLLRLILVNHSTLMMGRLGYYQGNLMTHVKPANAKLRDRAIRYVLALYQQDTGEVLPYAVVSETLTRMLPVLKPQESIVLKVVAALKIAYRSP